MLILLIAVVVQRPAIILVRGCENVAGKLRQECQAIAEINFMKQN